MLLPSTVPVESLQLEVRIYSKKRYTWLREGTILRGTAEPC